MKKKVRIPNGIFVIPADTTDLCKALNPKYMSIPPKQAIKTVKDPVEDTTIRSSFPKNSKK